MITKHDFQTLLKSPEQLSTLPLVELENLVRHYPWFSLGQTLLAKAYKEQQAYKFSDQLSLASTLSSNRNWLYSYIKSEQETSKKPDLKEEIEASLPVQNEVIPSNHLHSLAEQIVEAEDKVGAAHQPFLVERITPQEVQPTQEDSSSHAIPAVEMEDETEIGIPDSTAEMRATEGMDLLDKSILATAVSSSIYLEVGDNEQGESDVIDNGIDLSEDPFIQWLQQSQTTNYISEFTPANKEDAGSLEDLQNTQALIDRFIASEPKITPGKAEQYTGVSFAQTSLDDNFEWVTETMAKLYAVQGKIDRARKAYKRLMELHPEKKIYFENQLKALNQRK